MLSERESVVDTVWGLVMQQRRAEASLCAEGIRNCWIVSGTLAVRVGDLRE